MVLIIRHMNQMILNTHNPKWVVFEIRVPLSVPTRVCHPYEKDPNLENYPSGGPRTPEAFGLGFPTIYAIGASELSSAKGMGPTSGASTQTCRGLGCLGF